MLAQSPYSRAIIQWQLKKEKRQTLITSRNGKATAPSSEAVCETSPKKSPLQAICMLGKGELAHKKAKHLERKSTTKFNNAKYKKKPALSKLFKSFLTRHLYQSCLGGSLTPPPPMLPTLTVHLEVVQWSLLQQRGRQ